MRAALALVTSSLAVAALVAGAGTDMAAQRSITPVVSTSAVSGREIFQFHCASCHGAGGQGDGPVAAALRTPPSDLTKIAARTGHFPTDALRRFVAGRERELAAHGSREMPVWGPLFQSLQPRDALTDVRIDNVVRFIESLQKP